jgi:hypothetical protein
MDGNQSIISWVGNVFSGAAILGTLIGVIPTIAAVVALIWYLIQIYESNTVQAWRKERARKKLILLHQKVSRLELLIADTHDKAIMDKIKAEIAGRVDIDAAFQRVAQPKPDEPAI